jgi:hypothetical protein
MPTSTLTRMPTQITGVIWNFGSSATATVFRFCASRTGSKRFIRNFSRTRASKQRQTVSTRNIRRNQQDPLRRVLSFPLSLLPPRVFRALFPSAPSRSHFVALPLGPPASPEQHGAHLVLSVEADSCRRTRPPPPHIIPATARAATRSATSICNVRCPMAASGRSRAAGQ